jgi:hypothetical protein
MHTVKNVPDVKKLLAHCNTAYAFSMAKGMVIWDLLVHAMNVTCKYYVSKKKVLLKDDV